MSYVSSSRNLIILISGLLSITACEYDNAELISESKSVSFASDISPIIISKCALAGCHVESATIGDFNAYTVIKSRVDDGGFELMVFDLKIMPPLNSVPLSSTELMKLKKWIDQGAKNN